MIFDQTYKKNRIIYELFELALYFSTSLVDVQEVVIRVARI